MVLQHPEQENTERRSLVQFEDEAFEVLESHPSIDGRGVNQRQKLGNLPHRQTLNSCK